MRFLLFLGVLPWILPAVWAQGSSAPTPVLVRDSSPTYNVLVEPDQPVELGWTIRNLHPTDRFLVDVSVPPLRGWRAEIQPGSEFFVEADSKVNLTLTLYPLETPFDETKFSVSFAIYDTRTGAVSTSVKEVQVRIAHPPRIFGILENPLPPPLDGPLGVVLLDAGVAVAVALLIGRAVELLISGVLRKAAFETRSGIIHKIRRTLFFFLFFLGLHIAFQVYPSSPLVDGVEKGTFILYSILGVYLLYKILDSALYYYGAEIAWRTETELDDVLIPPLRKFAQVLAFVGGLLVVLRAFDVDLTLFVAGGAVASLVIAFAAQETISNFFSGIFILVDRPFVEGDDIRIESGDVVRVERIGLRSTRLYHYGNHEILVVPNNQLASKVVTNLTAPDEQYRISITVGVSYGTDVEKALSTLLEIARAHPGIVLEEDRKPVARFEEFGDSSLNLRLICYVRDFRERFSIASDLRRTIYSEFARRGIEIPFPQRTVWIKGLEGVRLEKEERKAPRSS